MSKIKMKLNRSMSMPNVHTRKEINKEPSVVIPCIKSLLGAYMVTGVLLLALAYLLYRFHLGEKAVAVSIVIIYIISTFVGGVLIGKYMKIRKYFWGFIIGILYVLLLFVITFGIYRTLNNGNVATTIILCMCSGTIGGMVS